jgi:hypothetical protein
VDLAPGMLAASQRINPECEHVQGDMRTVRLGRAFDGIFVHATICFDPEDTTYTVDYAYLFRETDGSIHVEHDRHIEGLFPRQTWLDVLSNVGFLGERVPFAHSALPGRELDVFVGRRAGT